MNQPDPIAAAAAATLSVNYHSYAEVSSRPPGWWRNVLGVVTYGALPQGASPAPMSTIGTPDLNGDDLCEVWQVSDVDSKLLAGSAVGGIRYRSSNELLFGCVAIEEGALGGDANALLAATENAYQNVFDLLDLTGHRHLVRIWNYLPDINGHVDGEERYRHFNSARQTAFRKSGRATMGTVPAASALGSRSGSPLAIYFLASPQPPALIENPRQTSAYHYPPKFGRHSPIFSRACLWGEPAAANLFISGTASIVGHETIHPGDVSAQTRETLVNISALLTEANRVAGSACYSLQALKLKVYVRRPEDMDLIAGVLAEAAISPDCIVYLRADVCRNDLLVEIEAVGQPAMCGGTRAWVTRS